MQIYSGNIFDNFEGRAKLKVAAIAHVCNCQGVMGSGIAKEIRARYPEAYQSYKDFELRHSGLKLGTMSSAAIRPDKIIYNLHAQLYYGTDRNRYLDYEGLYSALEKACDDMCYRGLKSIAVPFNMGSDRAGGDWNVVKTMVESVFDKANINVIAVKL